MQRILLMLLVMSVVGAAPAIALDEADRQRLNNGQGCPGCDLSEANLNGMNLNNQDLSGANLSGANLNGVSLYNSNLSHANLTGADFTQVHELNMEGAIFTDAILCNTKWIDGVAVDHCP